MSRIGREPITVPAGVEVTIAEGNVVTVKGPMGTITEALCPEMAITLDNGVLHVARHEDTKQARSPVSYTHLDVYKRQHSYLPRPLRQQDGQVRGRKHGRD